VGKNRYDKVVSKTQSLQRMFSSAGANKYTLINKFLAGGTTASAAAVQTPPTSPVSPAQADLDLLDSLVEQTLQSRPVDDQSAGATSTRAKETLPNRSVDQSNSTEQLSAETSPEAATAAQEAAPASEMQELSKELQEVSKETKEQREQAMIKEKQQAINDLAAASTTPVAVDNQPVVVLPITAASKEEAKFKTTAYSVKWLWEWCKKIGKMFAGAVVYKEEVEEA
jgi:hypothetical protein